jgi:hypothetical protein
MVDNRMLFQDLEVVASLIIKNEKIVNTNNIPVENNKFFFMDLLPPWGNPFESKAQFEAHP